ncbi:MAG TPA: hypothetical protein VHN77_02985 [Phycisphaerales bacterium]|nr:hypothetical protein [Phycisphaerales bacterium]
MTLRPADLSRRAGRASSKSVMLAAISGVVLVSIVGIIAWRNKGTAAPQAATQPTTAPDIRDFSGLQGRSGEGPTNAAIGKGKGFFAQYVDKDDPTRLAGEITADRSDPLPDRRYELTRPSAWFFQSDGRAIHVEADKGRFTSPAERAQPTDGMLEGNVRIRLFAATADGSRPKLDSVAPELDVTTTRVSVDWALGQLDMPEDVIASSPRLTFHGRGVSAQFDPTTQRLDQLHVASLVKPIVVRMRDEAPKSTTPGKVDQPPAGNTAPPPTTAPDEPPAPPEERFYTLAASESVEIRQGDRTARAEKLLAWARTLGNALPLTPQENAAQPTPTKSTAATAPSTPPFPAGSTPAAPAPTPNPTSNPESNPVSGPAPTDDISLFWKGPLLVQRIEQRPAELERDDSVIELAAPEGVVALDDTAAGLSARGSRLRYAASREHIAFSGATPTTPATVAMRGAGTASAPAFEIDTLRAVVRVPSSGQLTGDPGKDASPSPTIAWTEQAEFQFDSLRGGSSSLQRAVLVGGVSGSQGALTLNADSATAEFFAPNASDRATDRAASTRNLLKAVQLVGRARATDSKEARFQGDTIHVIFDPPVAGATSPTARRVEASGHALATRPGESLSAGTIVATLKPPQQMPTAPATDSTQSPLTGAAIDTVHATGGFTFTGKNTLTAQGDTLTVQAGSKSARLVGTPAIIEQAGARLRCPTIDLSAADSTVVATGEGDFIRTPPENDTTSPMIAASWSRSMMLDDTRGALAIDGDAAFQSVAGAPDDREDSSVKAQTIRVTFEHPKDAAPTPPVTTEQPTDEQPTESAPLLAGLSPTSGSSRRMLTAEGTSDDVANPVRLEVRRGGPEGRMLYVEGQKIAASNGARTVHVPGAGKLLNSDRRPDLANAPLPATGSRSTQEGALPGSGKGDALFTWKNDATLDIAAGSAELDGGVRMVHRRTVDNALTELECDHLTASIEEDLKTRRLSSVRADGQVWARSQGREMTAQLAIYNAPLGVLEATGGDGGEVLVSDPRSGEPLNARAIRWTLPTGRIEVIDPGAISGPR